MKNYTPREGSFPARLIEHLQAHGGSITMVQISELLGIAIKNVSNNLLAAVRHGVLVRDGSSYTLPDGTQAAPATDAPRKMRTLKQVAADFHASLAAEPWGGAAQPAFPIAPPRAGDPPAPPPQGRTAEARSAQHRRGRDRAARHHHQQGHRHHAYA